MKLSLNWLKDHIDITITPQDLAEKLTLSGSDVDSFEDISLKYQNIIAAKIVEIKPHSNADNLRVVIVNDGAGKREIVCGASNIKVNQIVPLALPGASLNSTAVIQATVIRGVKSNGMLCSPKELGLGDDHSEILILDKVFDDKIGQPLSEILGLNDVIFDLALTPNRGDCFSVRGIAREVAAVLKSKVKSQKSKLQLKIQNYNSKDLEVKIDVLTLCPKYCALAVQNVKVEESPMWLKNRLESVGLRTINNIVDITNYVMMDLGQPLHVFDAKKIKNQKSKIKIIVRRAKKGESLVTIDGIKRELDNSMLVIADDNKPIAIAGVMGGRNSEVSQDTKDIVLESAIFDAVSIRSTSRKLGLITESVNRFEKAVDWFLGEQALHKAAAMISEIAGGELSSYIIRAVAHNPDPISFPVRLDYINKLLGTSFSFSEVKNILERLGVQIDTAERQAKEHSKTQKFSVTIPSWRYDLKIPADIAEEVGRTFDYNKIKPVPILGDIESPVENRLYTCKSKVRLILKHLGYNEIYTYSFYGSKDAQFKEDVMHVEVENPISADQQYLRASLLPLILRKASMNLRFFEEVKIFEIGAIFIQSNNNLPQEETWLSGAFSCKGKSDYELYRLLKGDLEAVFKELNGQDLVFERNLSSDKHNGTFINIVYQEQLIGEIYILWNSIKEEYKIRQNIVLFNLNFDKLYSLSKYERKYFPIAEFPPVLRDLSFFVPQDLKYTNFVQFIISCSPLIEEVSFVDEYYIKAGERSLTIRITYRSKEKTLESREVDEIEKKIIIDLEGSLGVKLRK